MSELRRFIPTLFLLTFLASGCALSPQTVTVNPVAETEAIGIGRGRSIEVSARDSRPNRVIGSRGGAYDTSYIQTDESFLPGLEKAASDALAKWEFNPNGSGIGAYGTESQTPRFELEVISIKYAKPSSFMNGYINIAVTLNVNVEDGLRHYNGSYKGKYTYKYFLLPSEAKNNELVTRALNVALKRTFEDRQLQNFLEQ